MMRFALLTVAAASLLFAALPASAGDRVAHAAITSGAYDQAEKSIQAELRIHPGRPELLLNLAAVFAKTGREAQAKALYAQVLAQREVLMDVTIERVAGSHRIASNGLKRIQPVQLSAR